MAEEENRLKEIEEEINKILEKTKKGEKLTIKDKWKIDSLRLTQSMILDDLKNAK